MASFDLAMRQKKWEQEAGLIQHRDLFQVGSSDSYRAFLQPVRLMDDAPTWVDRGATEVMAACPQLMFR